MDWRLSPALLLSLAAISVAQEQPKKAKQTLADAWQEALRQAKRHKAPILAFVLPPADALPDQKRRKRLREAEDKASMLQFDGYGEGSMKTARELLLREVQLLRSSGRSHEKVFSPANEVQRVLALTVPVFAEATSCLAEEGENLVLLRCDGKRLGGWSLDLLDGDKFAKTLLDKVATERELLARRAAVTAERRKQLTVMQAALHAINDPQTDSKGAFDRAYGAKKKLEGMLPAVGPALVEHGDEQPFSEAICFLEEQRPPLGSTQTEDMRGHCMGCGMGFTPSALFTTLKLLGP